MGERPIGVQLVEKAIEAAGKWPGRLKDDEGNPGGLIELPAGLRPVIIGDLHANLDNLKAIMDHDDNRKDLDAGRAALLFIGDSVHDDRTGHMRDTDGSIAILDYILQLIVEYPRNVYYIRGNHDTFDSRLRKSGIAQGLEFRDAMIASRGADFATAVGRFFESLPVFIIGDGFVMTHAGPPRGGLVREELINISKYPEKYHQLQWNRVNEYHGNPSPKEYGEGDVRLVLDLLDMPADTQFIVGHNPLWNDGNKTGIWMNVIGIQGHHIIYSGSGSRAPYFTTSGGKLVVKLAVDIVPEVYNYG
ncbi:MAG: metallophosphoesterase [Spirochaetae bacterium HGW-Spirochaetae-7]|nr:MAG: metallophosphoesterase [Spirochaetae bacterium HGW-Spirochaetae-7]